MSSAKQILDHIDALGNFFTSMASMPRALEKARPLQIQSLKSSLANPVLNVREATDILNSLATMAFLSEDEKMQLSDVIVEKVNQAPHAEAAPKTTANGGKKDLQDYVALVHYMTEDMWIDLQSDERSASWKMNALLDHCVKLGLRNPSEPSMQCLTAVYLLTAERAALANMTPQTRLTTLQALKTKLRSIVQHQGNHGPHVCKLPVMATEFQSEFSVLWKAALAEKMPVASKFSLADLTECMRMIPMRRSRGDAKGHQPIQLDVSAAGSHAAQFATSIMQQMKQMQDMQHVTLQMFSGMQSGSFNMPTVSLPLEDKSPKILQRLNSRLALLDVPAGSQSVGPQQPNAMEVDGAQPEASTLDTNEAAAPEEQKQGKKASVAEAIQAVQQALVARKAAKDEQAPQKEKGTSKSSTPAGKKSTPVKKPQPKKQQQKSSTPVKKNELKPKPMWQWECTRSQIMCRTGLPGPGQCSAIKYKDEKEKKKAMKAADDWVAEQCIKFGIK